MNHTFQFIQLRLGNPVSSFVFHFASRLKYENLVLYHAGRFRCVKRWYSNLDLEHIYGLNLSTTDLVNSSPNSNVNELDLLYDFETLNRENLYTIVLQTE